MSSLYFYYSSMNAGKSSSLLQSAYNYKERGMHPMLITAAIDDRYDVGHITSRIGLASTASLFDKKTNMVDLVIGEHLSCVYDCILIDEAQFLTRAQVLQLCELVDLHKVPVLCYGLRTDFRGQLFEGSAALMALSDKLSELKSVCHCGRKATMVSRVDENGDMVVDGPQVEIGGNSRYVSVCRKHYMKSKPVKEGTPYVD